MSELIELTNIGKTVAARLEEIGVFSRSDLQRMGPAIAYQRIQSNYPEAHLPLCYYLYSLEGALENKHWRSYTEQQKAEMREKAGI